MQKEYSDEIIKEHEREIKTLKEKPRLSKNQKRRFLKLEEEILPHMRRNVVVDIPIINDDKINR